jgi:hypothetical protein
MQAIHGITQEGLSNAPSFERVKEQVLDIMEQFELLNDQKVILVGHSVVSDI